MHTAFSVGQEPIPGYKLIEELEGSPFSKTWKVSNGSGEIKLWKVIDMVVGNAAIETRTLGLLVQLRHPFLNTLSNFWQLEDGRVLIIESEVPLMSMRDRLAQCQAEGRDGIAPDELQQYVANAAEGLDFLNSPQHRFQGQQVAIYHRALRPDCLLIFEDGQRAICKVSDFGLAKPVSEQNAQHSQGLAHYDYDPPEFFEGQTAPTSDQYALAINYYELRTGSLPFRGTMLEQLQSRLNDAPDLTSVAEPERGVIRKALSRDPSRRFESCSEFARTLLSGATIADAVPEPAARPTPGAGRRMSLTPPPMSPASAPPPPSRMEPPPGRSTPAPMPRTSASSGETPGLRQRPPSSVIEPGQGQGQQDAAGAVVASLRGKKPPSSKMTAPENVRDLRKQLTAQNQKKFVAQPSGPRRIPAIWVVIILAITLIAGYFLATTLFPPAAPPAP